MLKNKSKLLILFIVVILLLSTFSFATEEPAVNTTAEETPVTTEEHTHDETESEDVTSDEEATTGDTETVLNSGLTIFEDDYTMDRLVDGNVYIFANNVTFSGQVNGNVIIFANNVTFTEEAYVTNSIYVAANRVDFSGICTDLNVIANIVNITYSNQTSFAYRDMNIAASSFTFAGGVGRDANVFATNFNFATEENCSGIVYGNLNYSSSTELELGAGFVEGEVTYTKISENEEPMSVQEIIVDKLVSLGTTIVYTAVVFLLTLLVAPKFAHSSTNKLGKLLPAIGIGLLTLIIIPVVFMLLMFTVVGVSLGFALIAIYVVLFFIYSSIVNIYVANTLKSKFKVEKTPMFLLVLLGTTIVIWALQQIPYIGGIVAILVTLAGAGLLVMSMFGNIKRNKSNKQTVAENKTEE